MAQLNLIPSSKLSYKGVHQFVGVDFGQKPKPKINLSVLVRQSMACGFGILKNKMTKIDIQLVSFGSFGKIIELDEEDDQTLIEKKEIATRKLREKEVIVMWIKP